MEEEPSDIEETTEAKPARGQFLEKLSSKSKLRKTHKSNLVVTVKAKHIAKHHKRIKKCRNKAKKHHRHCRKLKHHRHNCHRRAAHRNKMCHIKAHRKFRRAIH